MDFIEKIFGIAPDGGSGSLETGLILIPVMVIAAILFMRLRLKSD